MPSDFRIPPVGFGPGSQPSAADGEELSYMAMPKDMAVYMPHTPEVEDPEAVAPALALLRDVTAACAEVAQGRLAPVRPARAGCREPRADRRYAG
jgi:hydrogenase-1 operon protein HyaF